MPGKTGKLRIRSDEWGAAGGQGWPTIALDDDGKVRVAISYFDWAVDGQVICRRLPHDFHYATAQEVTEIGAAKARALKTEQLRRRSVITQSDAMHIALRILRQPRLARALAGRFDEFIIDEAQDSSDVQLACVQLLRETEALRSLVVVADLEQSIYGFQGADPAGCERLVAASGLTRLSLTRNFRSSQRICDVTSHFTRREKPDIAAGPHADCAISPEILRFPVGDPGAAVTTFSERLELHEVDAADAVVLSRSRSLRDKVNGHRPVRCHRVVRTLGQLAEARTSRRTLGAAQVAAAEETVLWCIDDSLHIHELPLDARRRLRAAVGRLLRELPETTGTLADWIVAARSVLNALFTDMVSSHHVISHKPGDVLKALPRFKGVPAAPVLGGKRVELNAQTVHAVKGCSVDAVLMVVEPPGVRRGDPALLLTDLGAGGGDLREREVLRIGFVALTRARRYCAVALADTVPEDVYARYEAMGFVPIH